MENLRAAKSGMINGRWSVKISCENYVAEGKFDTFLTHARACKLFTKIIPDGTEVNFTLLFLSPPIKLFFFLVANLVYWKRGTETRIEETNLQSRL